VFRWRDRDLDDLARPAIDSRDAKATAVVSVSLRRAYLSDEISQLIQLARRHAEHALLMTSQITPSRI